MFKAAAVHAAPVGNRRGRLEGRQAHRHAAGRIHLCCNGRESSLAHQRSGTVYGFLELGPGAGKDHGLLTLIDSNADAAARSLSRLRCTRNALVPMLAIRDR
ncbi:MAG: hypothetical protein M3Y41_07410 [Pseudomonadota bacterium]|nr:hypothetical protein [Pseudomonadota bacterium]